MLFLRHIVYIFILLSLWGCQTAPDELREEVERLNHKAFDLRYTHIDSTLFYARKALEASQTYSTGMAEAYNTMGFAAYMRQEFHQAEQYYELARNCTGNQLEKLIADIGMMKVCQRRASNRRFYDFYTRAKSRIERIRKETEVLNTHDLGRLAFAKSEFHLTACTYYYYIQQEEMALNELDRLSSDELLRNDSIQWVYYLYMKGSGGLMRGENPEDIALKEMDTLLRCLIQSRNLKLNYFEGNSLQAFSELLTDSVWAEAVTRNRPLAIAYLNPEELPDSLLPTALAEKAIHSFRMYGDHFQISCGYRTLASAYFQRGKYRQALQELKSSLREINMYSRTHNRIPGVPDTLQAYAPWDSAAVELIWLDNPRVQMIPEWIARVREQLSLTYSALGNKAASDYNRNIYLDILDRIREDKELESRYEMLNAELHLQDVLGGVIIGVLLIGTLLFVYLNRLWSRKNARQIEQLQQTAELCRKITSSIPSDVENEEQLMEAVQLVMVGGVKKMFGVEIQLKLEDGRCRLMFPSGWKMSKDERFLLSLITPYLDWAMQNGTAYINLADEHKQLEKERYLHEQHIIEQKRQNLDKRTCMSLVYGITPFLDRILLEIRKLGNPDVAGNTVQRMERYRYIGELVDQINEYNEILALWIQMKKGILSLHVEHFAVNELFGIMAKSRRAFEQNGITLNIKPTEVWVRADKALTLFMINTLMENARKFTSPGGTVTLTACQVDDSVEIVVADSGRGLSPEDVEHILQDKVYDSNRIGKVDGVQDNDLDSRKGFGFGLMNCRGIIEKYKKTAPLFSVCRFQVESRLGEGSRFSFRLPKGVGRLLSMLLLILIPSVGMAEEIETDSLLREASRWADSTYYSNVDGYYHDALRCADSACYYLNRHYQNLVPEGKEWMTLSSPAGIAEIRWWEAGLQTDYHIILDIRNEVAVAALAIGNWSVYRLNNAAYTRLYKLLSVDHSLDQFCQKMQKSADNRKLAFALLAILVLVFVSVYYLIYFRHALMYRINLQQAMEVNRKVLEISLLADNPDNRRLMQLPEQILANMYRDLNDIHPVEGIVMWITDGARHTYDPVASRADLLSPLIRSQMQEVIRDKVPLTDVVGKVWIYPLLIQIQQEEVCIGAFAFVRPTTSYRNKETLLTDLILSYVAIVIYQTLVRIDHKQADLEIAEDERRRAAHEESRLHVQNMMLDNCLSTLKHETMYYPNRIKQIVERKDIPGGETEHEQIAAMNELMTYYKDVFTLLSQNASRQLETVKLQRERLAVQDLTSHVARYFERRIHKTGLMCQLHVEAEPAWVWGDPHLLRFLLEHVVDAFWEEGLVKGTEYFLRISNEGAFVRFCFINPNGTYTQNELNQLFYPNRKRMQADETGHLQGTHYLICRQIIRDHDEMFGHKGCRINAEQRTPTGFFLWFTLLSAEITDYNK